MPLTAPNRPTNSVFVVGGGICGMAAAIRLAARGCSVTLIEKNAHLGGRLDYLNVPHPRSETPTATPVGGQCADRPFLFDTGPGLLTLPLVMADLFSAAGDDVRNHLQITRLKTLSQFIWADGSKFALPDSLVDLAEAVRHFAPADVRGVEKLLNHGRNLWELSAEPRLNQPLEQFLHDRSRVSPVAAWKTLTVRWRIAVLRKFAAIVDRNIRSQRLRDVFYQYAVRSGFSPHHAPAATAMIPFIQMEMGAWHVHGGMHRIAESLAAVARRLGVTILTGCPVAQIEIEETDGRPRATGVILSDGRSLRGDAVVVSADAGYAYRHLIPEKFRPSFSDARLDHLKPSGSGMAVMLGVDGTYPQLAHLTQFMPDDYSAELAAIFKSHTIPDDPCIHVCAPTRTDPTLAPDGCEILSIFCSAPPMDGKIDWAIEGPKYRDRIIHKLEHVFGLTDLSKRIVVERRITPADMAAMYNANAGSIYGLKSNGLSGNGLSGNGIRHAFRTRQNRDANIKGLFFTSAAPHLGGGPSPAALSGKIVSEVILKNLGLTWA